jgi:hypothetical protein
MSPLLQKVLTEIDRLEPSEQLSVMSHLVNRFNSFVTRTAPKTDFPIAKGDAAPTETLRDRTASHPAKQLTKISRQELLGCASGLISMRADFDEPLADFQDYM